jgi:transcriptional regulator with XRE-family HTH domain
MQQLRTRCGFTQEKLAELIGNSAKTISAVENGRTNVTLDVLAVAAVKLSVDLADLIGPAPGGPRFYMLTSGDFGQLEKALGVIERLKRTRVRRGRRPQR